MTIEEIQLIEPLSVRSINLCQYNDLLNLDLILNYYYENGTFLKLRNCGVKSNNELISLCHKYAQNVNPISLYKEKENELKLLISQFSIEQLETLNTYISISKLPLSVRSSNAISSLLNDDFSINNILNKGLLDSTFNILAIKNVGQKSRTEIEKFITNLSEIIYKISTVVSESDLIKVRNQYEISKVFPNTQLSDKIIESNSIFSYADYLIQENICFKRNQNEIFKGLFKIYNHKLPGTLDEVAKNQNITRERARQIRNVILENLNDSFEPIRTLKEDLFEKYEIVENTYQIKLDNDVINKINTTCNTEFTKEFIQFLVYKNTSDKYGLVGNYEDILLTKLFNSRGRHNWKHFYLIDNQITEEFDFYSFANDISNLLGRRIEKSYTVSFTDYLSRFLINGNVHCLIKLKDSALNILTNEFKISVNENNELVFLKNTFKQIHEYAVEALEILGNPSSVEDITSVIRVLYPEYVVSDSKVRISMKRKFGFVPVGRSSIFALKIWEERLENFKGGTIRSITQEFLESKIEPVHISEITTHILKYRPQSYERSIMDNLKADKSSTFIFYKNSRIGLSSKIYIESINNDRLIKSNKPIKWEDSLNKLISFIESNDRLPNYTESLEEDRIYRWLNLQYSKAVQNKLDQEKRELIIRIVQGYNPTKKVKVRKKL